MSESFPTWIAFIGVLAIVLGVLRGAMLRAQGFVPRGRKGAAPQAPPAPVRIATARVRVRQRIPKLGAVPRSRDPGLAR